MSKDPIATVTEAEATGEIAEIYADIRATTGVPLVNLIWRHLAAMPGGLRWAWDRARPIYAEGAAEAAALALFEELDLPSLPHLPSGVLTGMAVPVEDRDVITAMLDVYNRGNGLNLMALSALVAESAAGDPPAASTDPVALAGMEIPPIPAMSELSEDTVALIHRLNLLGARPQEPIIASLYRHLGYWPGYLAWMYGELAPMAADGRLARAIETTRTIARERARALVPLMGEAATCESEAEARAAITLFADHMISRMVPIGRILRSAM